MKFNFPYSNLNKSEFHDLYDETEFEADEAEAAAGAVATHSAFKGPVKFWKILQGMRYIFESDFCPKKEKIILKIFGWEKHPLTTISFEISIQEKSYRR